MQEAGVVYTTKTITVGFEQESPAAKPFLSDGQFFKWSSSEQDKKLYVFDGNNTRYTFNNVTSDISVSSRTFSCDSWPTSGEVKLVLWNGATSSSETLSGWSVSGSNLVLKNSQTIGNTDSFEQSQAISVMKKGDTQLKPVFGFLRLKNDPFPGGAAASVKKVVITADENIAGKVKVDYSGSSPVTTIISSASKTITAWTRYNKGKYEAGYMYVAMVPGTYHNVKMTIYPFATEATAQDTAEGTSFTMNADVLFIERGRYTDGGVLPYVKPVPVPDPEPGSPVQGSGENMDPWELND
ncbi:MAG: hypothetical protein J5771_05065 [Bacteroidales bacterium]|nr:hypothetical protein [Bacteroidales bacterium]